MSWFRLDDKGAFHAKVVLAGNEAYGAWCRAGQWSSDQKTDGLIPTAVAHSIGPARLWKRLADAIPPGHKFGLVEIVAGGFQLHDFLVYNPSAAEATEKQAAVSEAKRRAGRAGGLRSGAVRRGEAEPKQASRHGEAEHEAETKQPASSPGSTEASTAEAERSPDPVPDPVPDPDLAGSVSAAHAPNGATGRRTHTGRPTEIGRWDPEAPSSPEAAGFLADLLAFPSLASIATPRMADALAGELMSGKRAPDVRRAIADLGRKATSRAAANRPMSADELADKLASFIAYGRQQRAEPAADDPNTALAWACWRDEYQRRYKRRYLESPDADDPKADARVLARTGTRAAQVVQEHHRGEADAEELLRHWFRSFLRDQGPRGSFDEAEHALRLFEREVHKYGTPWTRPRRPDAPPAPEPPPEPPPLEQTADGASGVVEALAKKRSA